MGVSPGWGPGIAVGRGIARHRRAKSPLARFPAMAPPRRIAAMRESAVAERRRTRVAELEFTGCEPVRVSGAEIFGPEWEGRKLEYWHAATEIAWMVREPVSRWHERPTRRLARLLERIVEARGSDVECLGSTDLRIREPDGALTDLMQADETVYLHPAGANLPQGPQLIVGEDAYPDVVLEVDNTTDVRRGKLVAYAEWGFPEVWVEVPKSASPSRPAGLSPGLTIHLLEEGRYRESPESRTFPGWGAEEIHRALNEPVMSEDTKKDLRRVGHALGEREGTAPEDDPLRSRMERRARAAELAGVVRTILRQRGLAVSDGFLAKPESLLAPSREAVLDAAFTADDETDFLLRLGTAAGPDGEA